MENRGLVLAIRKTGDGVVDPAVNSIGNTALSSCIRVQSMARNQTHENLGGLKPRAVIMSEARKASSLPS